MEIDRLIKKEENTGKNIPDSDKFFTVKEKNKFFAGYGFSTFMVSQRFLDKMGAIENVEQDFKFDIPMLHSALTKGIVNTGGQHLTDLSLSFEMNHETGEANWCLRCHYPSESWFYLKDYSVTWTLWDKEDAKREY